MLAIEAERAEAHHATYALGGAVVGVVEFERYKI
jgi:hypothetical protein